MAVSQEHKPHHRLKSWMTEVGRSFFPSMGLKEWRSALRGDPAPRPNPRMRVHNWSFFYHIRPRSLSEEATAWYYTMGLGWLSFFFFVIEAITGAILMVYYSPSPNEAYGTMIKIINDVPLGNLMRNIHRLGAHFMVAIVFLHMLRTYFTASYKAPRQFVWVTGVILLLVTLFLSFSGYLLPWDQLAFWAVTIGTSMAEAAPLVGDAINKLLRGGIDIGAGALLRFYLLHIFALPMLAIILISVHYYAVRKHEISPIHELFENRPPSKRKIPFLPDQLFFEVAVIALLTFAFIFINQYFWEAKLESHANAFETPQHTKAPWYFFWLQGMLKLGDKQIMGLVLPGVIIGGLALLPYLDRNPSRKFKDRKIAITSGIVSLVVFVIISYAGLPAFGIQEVASNELAVAYVPVEGEGWVDHVPFSKLPTQQVAFTVTQNAETGEWTSQIEPEIELSPEVHHLFDQLERDVIAWTQHDPRFYRPSVTLTLTPWSFRQVQAEDGTLVTDPSETTLVRATLFMTWISMQQEGRTFTPVLVDGQPQYTSYTQVDYIHRDSHE